MTKANKIELQTTDTTKSMDEAIDNFAVRKAEEDKLLYEQFVGRLARGTTCSKFVEYVAEYRGYIIFHHKSHSEYMGNYFAAETCKAYLGYVKFNPDFKNNRWTDIFLNAQRVNARKTQKNIDYIVKTLIDGEIIN